MNTVLKRICFYFLLILIFSLNACKRNPLKIDVSHIELDINVYRFDELMFRGEANEVFGQLVQVYGDHETFLDIYTGHILQIGEVDEELFPEYLNYFLADTVYQRVADTVLTVFSNIDNIENDILKGFKHYKYYFPEMPVPAIYTYISGFNESIIVAEDFIGISLENYLGVDCEFYQLLGVPQFKILNKHPGKIISDVFYAWAITEFPNLSTSNNLLSGMIHHGKMMYFTEAMNPHLTDSLIIGYTAAQNKWCKQNEATMWSYLVERNEIYSFDRLTLQRYLGDAPFTNTFSSDSPGRTGIWLGWQIVRSFMNNNRDLTLKELMEIDNAQDILNRSGYFPD